MQEKLLKFLLEARTKAYAGSGGEVASVLVGNEKIFRNEKQIYNFFYAGGLVGKENNQNKLI